MDYFLEFDWEKTKQISEIRIMIFILYKQT